MYVIINFYQKSTKITNNKLKTNQTASSHFITPQPFKNSLQRKTFPNLSMKTEEKFPNIQEKELETTQLEFLIAHGIHSFPSVKRNVFKTNPP